MFDATRCVEPMLATFKIFNKKKKKFLKFNPYMRSSNFFANLIRLKNLVASSSFKEI